MLLEDLGDVVLAVELGNLKSGVAVGVLGAYAGPGLEELLAGVGLAVAGSCGDENSSGTYMGQNLAQVVQCLALARSP